MDAELAAKKKEIEALVQENATLTEGINNLEVCVGQLIKECRYLKQEVVRNYGKMTAKCPHRFSGSLGFTNSRHGFGGTSS